MIPQSWSKSGLNGATGFETSDRKIRRVDPDDLLSVLSWTANRGGGVWAAGDVRGEDASYLLCQAARSSGATGSFGAVSPISAAAARFFAIWAKSQAFTAAAACSRST
jgi:hypothetical protein